MAGIALPLDPQPASAVPFYLDFGGIQRGIAGGSDMRLDRLGNRYGLAVKMPAMKLNNRHKARIWVSRLLRGTSAGVIIPFPQPDFVGDGNAGSYVAVAAGTGAGQVSVNSNGAPIQLLEGQFFTHYRAANGQRYLYEVTADTLIPVGINTIVPLWPKVRGPMAVGDILDFADPVIEGLPVPSAKHSWTLEAARTVGLEFEIEERE